MQSSPSNEHCDVIVIGGGTAAFEAAVSAREHGAERVVVLEKAPESESGGNARFSHTGFRFVYSGRDELREFLPDLDDATFDLMHIPAYTNENFTDDLLRVTQGRINPVLAETMVSESNSALHWMLDLGIKWEPASYIPIDGKWYFEPGIIIHPVGGTDGGRNQLVMWRDIAEAKGIDLRFESRVSALHGNDRRIDGVRVSTPTGEYDLLAKAVILCSGGFQASRELRARYLGPNADLMKVRGSKHDTGEVLQMALALGAKSAGHWQGAHSSPIDASFPDVEVSNRANRYDYTYGITVNSMGARFYDEGEANHSYTYAKTGWAVLAQPGGVAYQIFDKKGSDLQNDRYYAYAKPVLADTIADLATAIGIEPAVLEHTVGEYNDATQPTIEFGPGQPDGKSTVGLAQKKSNWAFPLDTPPFSAIAVTAGITFTFGGVDIDTDARVLNTADQPIKGLYASGDVVGLFFHNYPSCTGQTRNAVFSRIAGRGAALEA